MSSLDLTVPLKGSSNQALPLLGGQALAALGAASLDNSTAATGGHAGTEAMGLGTTTLVGLVSTFHYDIPPRVKRTPLLIT